MATLSIWPAQTREGLAAVLDVARRVSGDPVPTVAELEHVLAIEPGSTFLVGHYGDELAASGVGKISSLVGCLFAMVRVLPDFRRRGVGQAMYSALSAHARAVGRAELFGRVREDDVDAMSAVKARGFREIGREFPVVLDLAKASAQAGIPPAGVEITNLAERPDLMRAAWEVEVEAAPDIPTEGGVEAWPFERWRSIVFDAPTSLPEAAVVAVADGEVVGSAFLYALTDGAAEHGLTAVRRAMRGINERLGYEPAPSYMMVRGPLAA